mgnify:CR=1 FL=1
MIFSPAICRPEVLTRFPHSVKLSCCRNILTANCHITQDMVETCFSAVAMFWLGQGTETHHTGKIMNAGSFAPALVLNADFRPLNYFPLSLWSWQDAVKAVCLDRVTIVSEYEDSISSPSFEMKLPSVIALKEYVPQVRNPAFTRFNVFLRDKFSCQYCGTPHAAADLTFDHVVPRSRGGRTTSVSYTHLTLPTK